MTFDENDSTRSSSRNTGFRELAHPPITTDESFQEALRALVLDADAHGVDVCGGWAIESNGADRAWDIKITRVSRRSVVSIEDSDFPASAVADAVAERDGVDTTDLPPLYDAIGPDVLEVLHDAEADSDHSVTFDYAGYTITVSADGTIVIRE